MNENDFTNTIWIRSIIGFIIAFLSVGLMWIFFKSVFSFFFLTPIFSIKYLGHMHLLKIILIIFAIFVVINIFQDALKANKKKK